MASDLLSALLVDVQPEEYGSSLTNAQNDKSLRKLVEFVKATNQRALLQPVGDSSLLELLDPKRNTISYLAVLLAYTNLAQKTHQLSPAHLEHVKMFLTSFDAVQARYVGQEFREIISWLVSYYEATNNASIVPFIGTAILRLDQSGSTFTSTHLLFVRLCLSASLPSQALSVLDKDIYNLPTDPLKGIDDRELCAPHESSATFITRASGISAEIAAADVQEYYLLGAQIYIAVREWARAKLFLELVLASPTTHVATPLMVEAYKKLILLGLLVKGAPFSSKSGLDQQAQKTVSALAKVYVTLADTFKKRDVQKFNAEIDAAAVPLTDDGNLGLANQAAESLRRFRVIDLQSTYSALPIDRIAVHLSLSQDATTALLTTMIRDGHIKATISQSASNTNDAPILRFLYHDSTHTPVGLDQSTILQTRYYQIESLSKHLREADRKLAISKEYTDYVRRSKRAEGAGAPGYEDPMEETWDAPTGDADEDMMSDLR